MHNYIFRPAFGRPRPKVTTEGGTHRYIADRLAGFYYKIEISLLESDIADRIDGFTTKLRGLLYFITQGDIADRIGGFLLQN